MKPLSLVKSLLQQRYMITTMAQRELRTRYVGSLMGVFWSVIYPVTMVFVYWFVFSLGFKVQPTEGIPFVVWFFCAFVPWSTFNDMITVSTNSVIANHSLVKRTLFPSEILPFIHLLSSGITHLIMLGILVIMLGINGIGFSWYNLQFLYYWLIMSLGMVGLAWLVSAWNVFIRDIGQVISVVLQIWFWATPIFWKLDMLPEKYHSLLKLNPMFHIVEGYRNSFLYHRPFWEDGMHAVYLWGTALGLFVIGGLCFQRLKSEFADVL